MYTSFLKKAAWWYFLFTQAALYTAAQNCPSNIQINAYAQVTGNNLDNTSNYSIVFSITGWNNNWSSYQVSVSADNRPYLVVKSCSFLPNNPPESGVSTPFTASNNASITARFEFGTSGGNCLGGSNCTQLMPLAVLPVRFSHFYVRETNKKPLITWQAESEGNVKQYIIEHSHNGQHFAAIATLPPANGSANNEYSYADNRFSGTSAWYRIVAEEKDGSLYYTEIKKYKSDFHEEIITWPVPANNFLFFSMKNHAGYRYRVVSVSGKIMETGTVSETSKLNTTTYPSGMYVLNIFSGTQNNNQVFVVAH